MSKKRIRQYLGIIRDHSGSMSSLASAAAKDYNDIISGLKTVARTSDVDTIVSVVKCGVGHNGIFQFESKSIPLHGLHQLTGYVADGNWTPLFDSVVAAIRELQTSSESQRDEDASFLIMAITDGKDNRSNTTAAALGAKIAELQGTDKWSFIFRVPHGYKARLAEMGIPEDNILEWERTPEGIAIASDRTTRGFKNYYAQRAKGVRSTRSFYANLDHVAPATVRAEMKNITGEVKFYPVTPRNVLPIREFIEKKTRRSFVKGNVFYQLTKPEIVQDYKKIAIRNQNSKAVYVGQEARQLLGIPAVGNIRLIPGKYGEFNVFVQSTSYNRKLIPGTELMFYPQKASQ